MLVQEMSAANLRNVEKNLKKEFVCNFLANYSDDQNQSTRCLSQTVHPPKPQRVLPCLLRAQTTSRAVTVFLLACSVQTTESLMTFSRNPLRTARVSSQMYEEILFTPPLRANLRMAGLVIPRMESRRDLRGSNLLAPDLPPVMPPFPFPRPPIFALGAIVLSLFY